MQSNSLLYLYEKFSVASMTETIIQTRFWTQDWRVEVTDPLKFPLTALLVWFRGVCRRSVWCSSSF